MVAVEVMVVNLVAADGVRSGRECSFLLEQLMGSLVGHLYPRLVRFALAIDPVDLPILVLELAPHVKSHIPQIANHCVHLAHVVLHLRLARVVRDLSDVAALRPKTIAVVHHPLRLVVHDLAVVVALPRTLVLLETGAFVTGKDAETAALFHSGEILLGLSHVGVNLVHALLDSVQLFALMV